MAPFCGDKRSVRNENRASNGSLDAILKCYAQDVRLLCRLRRKKLIIIVLNLIKNITMIDDGLDNLL